MANNLDDIKMDDLFNDLSDFMNSDHKDEPAEPEQPAKKEEDCSQTPEEIAVCAKSLYEEFGGPAAPILELLTQGGFEKVNCAIAHYGAAISDNTDSDAQLTALMEFSRAMFGLGLMISRTLEAHDDKGHKHE